MLGITAGMDQKECYVSPCRKLRMSAVAVPRRSSISCCGAEAYSHGLAVQQTIEFPQLLRYMWSMSLLCRSCSFPGGLQFSDTLMTCPLLWEVQRDVRVHGSSCGDVLHSPFDRKHHRCHCSCRYFVLFVGRRPLCAAGVFASRCRVVV